MAESSERVDEPDASTDGHPSMRLTCQECAVVAQDDAFRWRALLALDPDDAFEQTMLAFYCPTCAEREFGPRCHIDSSQASPNQEGWAS